MTDTNVFQFVADAGTRKSDVRKECEAELLRLVKERSHFRKSDAQKERDTELLRLVKERSHIRKSDAR